MFCSVWQTCCNMSPDLTGFRQTLVFLSYACCEVLQTAVRMVECLAIICLHVHGPETPVGFVEREFFTSYESIVFDHAAWPIWVIWLIKKTALHKTFAKGCASVIYG